MDPTKIQGCLFCSESYFVSNPGCGSESVCTDDGEGGVPPFMVECAVNQSACPLECQDQLSMASLCVMGAPSTVTFPDSTIFRRGGCVNANIVSRMDLSPGSRLENRNRRIWLPRVSRQKAKTRRATENAVGRREVRREWRERERSGGWRYIERPRRDRLKSVGVAVDVSTLPDSTTEPGPATPSCPPTSISSAVESPSPEFKRSKRGRVSIVIGRAAASTELRSGPRSARHRTRHGRGTRGRPSGRSASDNPRSPIVQWDRRKGFR